MLQKIKVYFVFSGLWSIFGFHQNVIILGDKHKQVGLGQNPPGPPPLPLPLVWELFPLNPAFF